MTNNLTPWFIKYSLRFPKNTHHPDHANSSNPSSTIIRATTAAGISKYVRGRGRRWLHARNFGPPEIAYYGRDARFWFITAVSQLSLMGPEKLGRLSAALPDLFFALSEDANLFWVLRGILHFRKLSTQRLELFRSIRVNQRVREKGQVSSSRFLFFRGTLIGPSAFSFILEVVLQIATRRRTKVEPGHAIWFIYLMTRLFVTRTLILSNLKGGFFLSHGEERVVVVDFNARRCKSMHILSSTYFVTSRKWFTTCEKKIYIFSRNNEDII